MSRRISAGRHPIVTEASDGTMSITIADGVRVRWRHVSNDRLMVYLDRDNDSEYRVDTEILEHGSPLQ
jgi:hypothetical protein